MNRREFLKDGSLVVGSLVVAPHVLFNGGGKLFEPQGDKIACFFYMDTTSPPEQKEIEWSALEQIKPYFKRAEIVYMRSEYMFFEDIWGCGGRLKVWGFTEKGRKKFGERFRKMKKGE